MAMLNNQRVPSFHMFWFSSQAETFDFTTAITGLTRCSPDAEDSDVPWRCNGCYGSSYHSLEPRIIQMVSAKIEPVNWPATAVSVGRTHHVDVRFAKSRILFLHTMPLISLTYKCLSQQGGLLAKLLSGSIFSTPKIIKNHGYSPFFAIVGR